MSNLSDIVNRIKKIKIIYGESPCQATKQIELAQILFNYLEKVIFLLRIGKK